MSKAPKMPKKVVRKEIVSRLEITLADLEEKLGKPRFKRRIRKAAKLLAANLKAVPRKADAKPERIPGGGKLKTKKITVQQDSASTTEKP